jgi:hypothetical protein
MKQWVMKLALSGAGLTMIAVTMACGGAPTARPQTPSSASSSASVDVSLKLPTVGNPKYDSFFRDVADLSNLVATARTALENAPATLNTAMNVSETSDFDAALKNISDKLKGKIIVTIDVEPASADVSVVAAPGVTLSPEEQLMTDAYKKVATDVALIPMKLEPVVAKSIAIAQQALALVASAKADFTGIKGLMTLPSVVSGLQRVVSAMGSMKTDVPVMVEKSKTMTVAIQGAVQST